MKVKRISESHMTFVVDEDATFEIEKADCINRMQGVKIVEFVSLLGDTTVSFVEAKTSAPNPEGFEPTKFPLYIKDIIEKFQNSIALMNVAAIKRRRDIYEILPMAMQEFQWAKAQYKLYLVIKNHRKEWLFPVSDALKKGMKPILKCWGIPDSNLKVINEDIARERQLID